MKKLYRSRTDRVIAGICGGMGEMLGIDPVLVRLGMVFLCLVTGIVPILLTYVIAWLIIPPADEIG